MVHESLKRWVWIWSHTLNFGYVFSCAVSGHWSYHTVHHVCSPSGWDKTELLVSIYPYRHVTTQEIYYSSTYHLTFSSCHQSSIRTSDFAGNIKTLLSRYFSFVTYLYCIENLYCLSNLVYRLFNILMNIINVSVYYCDGLKCTRKPFISVF